MGKKAKVAEAIPVPHDGFIHFFFCHKANFHDDEDHRASGVLESFAVLSIKSTDLSPTERLWSSLNTATENSTQLQALRAYRNGLSNMNSAQLTSIDESLCVGTYRTLLELSLSCITNQPLRRASRVNVEALRGILPFERISPIDHHVVSTIWLNTFWANPLQTLHEALDYPPLSQLILQEKEYIQRALDLLLQTSQSMCHSLEQSSFYCDERTNATLSIGRMNADVELTTSVAATLKALLTRLLQQDGFIFTSQMNAVLDDLNGFLFRAISSTSFQADGLSKLCVAFGQTLYIPCIRHTSTYISDCVKCRMRKLIDDDFLPILNILCTVQGMTVVLPDEILLHGSPLSVLEDLLIPFFLRQCIHSIDTQTRLIALRSLQTLLCRCCSIVKGGIPLSPTCFTIMNMLSQEALQIVMSAWENPSGRQVAGAIPPLFHTVLDFMESLNPSQNQAISAVQDLVARVLAQPLNQKGRYIALETLLPIVGAKTLLDNGGNRLIASLVHGVGDGGQAAGNIASLLGKILAKRREEIVEELGLVEHEALPFNRKQRLKLEQRLAKGDEVNQGVSASSLRPEWIDLWAYDFASGLLSKSHVRRKQVSSFCIPLLETMVGGSSRRIDASFALSCLLDCLDHEYERQNLKGLRAAEFSHDAETMGDIFLWAKLEIARQAMALRLLGSTVMCRDLWEKLRSKVPADLLQSSLNHRSARIRLAAFAALEPVLSVHFAEGSATQAVYVELKMWKSAFPYALKSDGKEYIASLLEALTGFMDRLVQAELLEAGSDILFRYTTFVNKFLLGSILLKQLAYPGTVQDKELCASALLHCLINIASRTRLQSVDGSYSSSRPQNMTSELVTLRCVRETLLSFEVFCMIFSLCHSKWDGTRSEAFSALVSLVQLAKRHGIPLTPHFQGEQTLARGIFLSASPRQREADTGSIILAFLCFQKSSLDEQEIFLSWLSSVIGTRVDGMKESLKAIIHSTESHDDAAIQKAISLPLAHGFFQSVKFIIDVNRTEAERKYSCDYIVELVEISLLAIRLSLSVIADVKEGQSLEGVEDFCDLSGGDAPPFPVNVNTGAIGANATFSSIKKYADNETLRRFATQRVVMGSWLMTREACATLTSLIIYDPNYVPFAVVEQSGQMLITTMTALKHQGAAYAAQKALQQISFHCTSKSPTSSLRSLPLRWSERLIEEISSTEKVRDSTLRRSTGYALAFLALMRSEVSLKVFPRILCPSIVARLVMLSLPPKSIVDDHVAALGLTDVMGNASSLFSDSLQPHIDETRWLGSACDVASRVHSLNILRLIILDAPLALEVLPFVGDCIIASIVGYSDDSWAVRNSATMVFSAAMLRVVDSDKNAARKDDTNSHAISAVEFFRRYFQLKPFLLGALKQGLKYDQWPHSSAESLHSPVFFVLLLLARLQPVRQSGGDSSLATDCFVTPVIKSLCHKEHKIRVIAGRALANIASLDPVRASHHDSMLRVCVDRLGNPAIGWNELHGLLIGVQNLIKVFSSPSSTWASQTIWSLCTQLPSIPPSCLAMAIEIRRLCLRDQCADDEELIHFCLGIIQKACNGSLVPGAGCSTLYQVAGRVGTQLLCRALWERRVNHLQCAVQLRSFLSCNFIDTRLISSKVFKKTLYAQIDELLLSDLPVDTKSPLLECVAGIFLDSLIVELKRIATSESCGVHPPTVRRLSRSLLECLYAMKGLGFIGIPASELWNVAGLMISNLEVENIDSSNNFIGNALEIMGFYFAGTCENNDLDVRSLRFASIAAKLTDPSGPWRVRHSVACAIKASSLLRYPRPLLACRMIKLEILKLLQDSDPDVRFVAASCAASKNQPPSPVDMLAIEQAYVNVCGGTVVDDSLLFHLLTRLVERYSGLSEKLELLMADLTRIETPTESSLLNIDTTRKIFEDEVPNTYEESLLVCHLVASALVGRDLSLHKGTALLQAYTKLMRIGLELLETLSHRYSQSERHAVMNDVTRQNALFPDIQGVLVACIATVYIGGITCYSLQNLACTVVSRCGENPTMHPIVLDTLMTLSKSKLGDKSTRDGLMSLCFLASDELTHTHSLQPTA